MSIKRKVTEADFRLPEYREANPDDYEFRDDGKIVRKDRWMRGLTDISAIVFGARYEFEIPEVVVAIRKREALWHICSEFISDHQIYCGEQIYDTDKIAEDSLILIESLCDVIGYLDVSEGE